MFFKKFRIPPEVKKTPSVDTLPIADSESTIADAKPNLSQLYLSRLIVPKPTKLNFFKTPSSGPIFRDEFMAWSVILSVHSTDPQAADPLPPSATSSEDR